MDALWWLPRTDVVISISCTLVALALWLRSTKRRPSIRHNAIKQQHNTTQALDTSNKQQTKSPTLVDNSSSHQSTVAQCKVVALIDTVHAFAREGNGVMPLTWSDVPGHIYSAAVSGEHVVLLTQRGHVYEWNINFNDASREKKKKKDNNNINNRDQNESDNNNNNNSKTLSPTLVDSLARLRAFGGHVVVGIACGPTHALAMTSRGFLFSWGDGANGRLGHGTTDSLTSARQVMGFNNDVDECVSISCGAAHSLAATRSGLLYSWGCGADGRLGTLESLKISSTSTLSPPSPSRRSGSFSASSPSRSRSSSRSNLYRSAPFSPAANAADSFKPRRVARFDGTSGLCAVQVSCGADFSVCVDVKGELYAWGSNMYGQCGLHMSTHLQARPCRIHGMAGRGSVLVRCGDHFAVALAAGGRLFTWGSGARGQLGTGFEKRRQATPLEVSVGAWCAQKKRDPIVDVACGGTRVSVLTLRGKVVQWGDGVCAPTVVPLDICQVCSEHRKSDDGNRGSNGSINAGGNGHNGGDNGRIGGGNGHTDFGNGHIASSNGQFGGGNRDGRRCECEVKSSARVLACGTSISIVGMCSSEQDVMIQGIGCGLPVSIPSVIPVNKSKTRLSESPESALSKSPSPPSWTEQAGIRKESGKQRKRMMKDADQLRQRELWWHSEVLAHPPPAHAFNNISYTTLPWASKMGLAMWEQGIPTEVRGKVWLRTVGNSLRLNNEAYCMYSKRAGCLFTQLQVLQRRSSFRHQHKQLSDSEINSPSRSTSDSSTSSSSSPTPTRTPTPPPVGIEPPAMLTMMGEEHTLKLIDTDLPRTLAGCGLFAVGHGPLYDTTRDALAAHVCYRPDVGYVQGMSYIAAGVCLHVTEPWQAFVCLANLMAKGHLFTFLRMHVDAMQRYYTVFENIMNQHSSLAPLAKHLRTLDIGTDLFLFPWFQTLFLRTLELPLALRVVDVFLLQGSAWMVKVALGVLILLRPVLVTGSFEDCVRLLSQSPGTEQEWKRLVTETALFDVVGKHVRLSTSDADELGRLDADHVV